MLHHDEPALDASTADQWLVYPDEQATFLEEGELRLLHECEAGVTQPLREARQREFGEAGQSAAVFPQSPHRSQDGSNPAVVWIYEIPPDLGKSLVRKRIKTFCKILQGLNCE